VARQIKDQNIVIVEDDVNVCEALETYFSAQNKVQTFASAEDAIAVAANFHDTDVFIIDYKLPEKNGVELFQHLRESFPEAKYILITGEMNYDLADRTRQIGFDALILKPFDVTILDDNISGLIATTA
jgi:DNA-binding NarL/FixJ family response regulator